jgi:hypothetical protein
MKQSDTEKCCYCRTQDAHPAYNDWCEDCYADIRLTRMYGRRQKDRSIRNSPKLGLDLDKLLGD